MVGQFNYDSHQSESGDSDDFIYVQFPATAPEDLVAADIRFGTLGISNSDAACTGTITDPTAPPGKVCVYLASWDGIDLGFTSTLAGYLPNRGFSIGFVKAAASGGSDMYASGTWAYTAP